MQVHKKAIRICMHTRSTNQYCLKSITTKQLHHMGPCRHHTAPPSPCSSASSAASPSTFAACSGVSARGPSLASFSFSSQTCHSRVLKSGGRVDTGLTRGSSH